MALPTCTAPITHEGKELTGTEITQETLRLALQRCTNVRTRQLWHSGAGVSGTRTLGTAQHGGPQLSVDKGRTNLVLRQNHHR